MSKNQLLSSKIAGSSSRTDRHARTHAHTHTEKTKLRDPFFSAIYFFVSIGLRIRIGSTCNNKGGLTMYSLHIMKVSKISQRWQILHYIGYYLQYIKCRNYY